MAATASTGRLPQREPTPWINHALRLVCAMYLTLIVAAVIAYKSIFIEVVVADPWFGAYSVIVCVFILSRFLFSLFYHPAPEPEQPAGADRRRRHARLQRGGRGRELDPLAARRRTIRAKSSRSWS